MSKIFEWYEKQSDMLRLIFVIISGVALATSLTFSWTGKETQESLNLFLLQKPFHRISVALFIIFYAFNIRELFGYRSISFYGSIFALCDCGI